MHFDYTQNYIIYVVFCYTIKPVMRRHVSGCLKLHFCEPIYTLTLKFTYDKEHLLYKDFLSVPSSQTILYIY